MKQKKKINGKTKTNRFATILSMLYLIYMFSNDKFINKSG